LCEGAAETTREKYDSRSSYYVDASKKPRDTTNNGLEDSTTEKVACARPEGLQT
jgi:hypothetical protein